MIIMIIYNDGIKNNTYCQVLNLFSINYPKFHSVVVYIINNIISNILLCFHLIYINIYSLTSYFDV